MKRLLFLPLLALPLLFLSCDGETLTEPDVSDSQALLGEVGPLSAPLPSPLDIYCDGTSCSESGGDFYGGGQDYYLWYNVCPAAKGTITIYRCQEHGYGSIALKDRCLNHDGAGWTRTNKRVVADTGCNQIFYSLTATSVPVGWKVKYTGQGSGYKNSTVYFDTYPGSP